MRYFSPDHSVFQAAVATHDGTRWLGKLGRCESPSPEEGEARRADAAAQRQLFLTIMTEDQYDWLQDVITEGPAAVARREGRHRATIGRRFHRETQEVLRLLLARKAADVIAAGARGFTLDPRTAQFVDGVDAWAVSLASFEERYDVPPTFEQIGAYIARWERVLFFEEDLYLGGWLDEVTGQWHLDLSRLFPGQDEDAALSFADLNGQQAITHLSTLATIRIDQKKRRAA
jgi:hypothetical protein